MFKYQTETYDLQRSLRQGQKSYSSGTEPYPYHVSLVIHKFPYGWRKIQFQNSD